MSTILRPTNANALAAGAIPVEGEVTDAGTVEDGAYSIGFLNTHATASCTVNGRALAAGVSKTYPFVGKQYGIIPYDATSSSLEICAIF